MNDVRLVQPPRVPPEWRNYCVYSGKFLPDAALSKEDVVPKSLGGNRFTVIYASRTLNSTFGAKIDAPVINDPIVQFGRKDVNARGHSKKKPIPKLTRAHHWNPRATPPPQGPGNYDLNVHGHGPPDVWDRKRGAFTPSSVWADGGFIIPNLNIDHAARLKFCVKTLVGMGWKLFQTNLLSAFDMEFLRSVLTMDFQLSTETREGGLAFVDEALISAEHQESHFLTRLKPLVIRKSKTSMLMRELDGTFEWTIACLGHLVGNVRVPMHSRLIDDSRVVAGGGLLFVIDRDGLKSEPIPRID